MYCGGVERDVRIERMLNKIKNARERRKKDKSKKKRQKSKTIGSKRRMKQGKLLSKIFNSVTDGPTDQPTYRQGDWKIQVYMTKNFFLGQQESVL